MKIGKVIGSVALILTILISMLLIQLPSVLASATVHHASFPPDLPGDVSGSTPGVPDRVVNMRDIFFEILHFNAHFNDANWDPRADVNDDGVINMRDEATVSLYFNRHYLNMSISPIAYSQCYEFDLPDIGNTWPGGVWYYMIARVYLPPGLSSNTCFLRGSHNGDVGDILIDRVLKSSWEDGGQPFNVTLGNLSQGYHLLELQYLQMSDPGSIVFNITTSANETIWLDRLRICVPSFSIGMFEYNVATNATFCGGDFFLGGIADKYIDNVYMDYGLLWEEWMWDAGPGGTIYGCGDGFMYPLGTPDLGVHAVSFTYGNNMTGALDFQFVSRLNQSDRIGSPKFYASAGISNLGPNTTLNNANIYGGSRWATNPGVSQRNFTVLTAYNFSYSHADCWFNTLLNIELGNWWATWELGGSQPPDFAIPLNFTVASLTSNLWSGLILNTEYYWDVHLKNYTIDTYSFQSLQIQGMENGQGQSYNIIHNDWSIGLDFAGTTIMGVTAVIPMYSIPYIGAGVGLLATGVAAAIGYLQGQHVSEYTPTIQQNNHWQLTANHPMDLYTGTNSSSKSKSELIFLGSQTTGGGYQCGLTEVVLKGTLEADYNIAPLGGDTQTFCYPLGDINATLCIPWFIWSST